MKCLYLGIGLLILSFTACLVSVIVLQHHADQTTALLEQAKDAAHVSDYDTALVIVEEAGEYWRSHQNFFGTVLSHDEADSVISSFEALAEYARYAIEEEFASNCAELVALIEHIVEMEWPHIYNIL
ncbi:MAG: DUF4363 family protein [Eubacteriales bacterium]